MFTQEPFEQGPIRPVAEGESLLIRTTRGCSWHSCKFCTSYKGFDFSIRSVDEVKRDIESAAKYYRGYPFESCFLQDGDSLIMKTADLLDILGFLNQKFPRLKRITSYGRASTVARKSAEELTALREAGLNRIYCGMESGSNKILSMANKGITAADIVASGTAARRAGIEVSEFIILGLGGRELSEENAIETARILSEVDPAYIRVRTIRVKPGTGMDQLRLDGAYTLQSEEEIIAEQRLLVQHLTNATGVLSNDHSMNLLMEVEGKLAEDREAILATLDRYLALTQEDKELFNIGARIGQFRRLEEIEDPRRKQRARQAVEAVKRQYPMPLNELYNYIRIATS